jgi:hypothetical protein
MESSATIGPPGHGDTLAAMGILKRRSHQWVDARSLELARAIAAKVAAEPPYLDRARATPCPLETEPHLVAVGSSGVRRLAG